MDLSATQSGLPALSSGESEYRGLTRCAVEALYVRSLLKFLRIRVDIELETDSSAAKGTVGRLGAGKKMRHLQVQEFYLQGLVKQGLISVKKVKGTEQVADLGTKYLSWPVMQKLLGMLDVKLLTFGGAAILPKCEAASSDIVTTATSLVFIGEQLDYLIEWIKWKFFVLLMMLLLVRLVWGLIEKVMVEITAEKAKVLLGKLACCRGRPQRETTERDELRTPEVIVMRPELVVKDVYLRPVNEVHGIVERGNLKVHLYGNCGSLMSRSSETKGVTKQVCQHCRDRKKLEDKKEVDRVTSDIESQIEDQAGARWT